MSLAAPKAHFYPIGLYQVDSLMGAVIENDAMFGDVTFRQDHLKSPHRGTETIYLRWPRKFDAESALHSLEVFDQPAMKIRMFSKYIEGLERILDNAIARAIIVKMHPGAVITPHIDQGAHAEATTRYHLALKTNPYAWLRSGGQTYHIERGELCWFDKHSLHEGANNGATDRIHLIVDCAR